MTVLITAYCSGVKVLRNAKLRWSHCGRGRFVVHSRLHAFHRLRRSSQQGYQVAGFRSLYEHTSITSAWFIDNVQVHVLRVAPSHSFQIQKPNLPASVSSCGCCCETQKLTLNPSHIPSVSSLGSHGRGAVDPAYYGAAAFFLDPCVRMVVESENPIQNPGHVRYSHL